MALRHQRMAERMNELRAGRGFFIQQRQRHSLTRARTDGRRSYLSTLATAAARLSTSSFSKMALR